jgi:hypothetical protein
MITGEGVGLFCFPYTTVFISEYRNSSGLDNSGGIYELLQVIKNLYRTVFLYSATYATVFHKKSKFFGTVPKSMKIEQFGSCLRLECTYVIQTMILRIVYWKLFLRNKTLFYGLFFDLLKRGKWCCRYVLFLIMKCFFSYFSDRRRSQLRKFYQSWLVNK